MRMRACVRLRVCAWVRGCVGACVRVCCCVCACVYNNNVTHHIKYHQILHLGSVFTIHLLIAFNEMCSSYYY